MEICKDCETENDDNAIFCKNCGKRIKAKDQNYMKQFIISAWIILITSLIPMKFEINFTFSVIALISSFMLLFSKRKSARNHGVIILIVWLITFCIGLSATGTFFGELYHRMTYSNNNIQNNSFIEKSGNKSPTEIPNSSNLSIHELSESYINKKVQVFGVVDFADKHGNYTWIFLKDNDGKFLAFGLKGDFTYLQGTCIAAEGILGNYSGSDFSFPLNSAEIDTCTEYQEANAN